MCLLMFILTVHRCCCSAKRQLSAYNCNCNTRFKMCPGAKLPCNLWAGNTTFSPKIKQIKLFWPQTLKPQQTFKQALVSGWRSNIAEWLEHEHCNKYRPFIYDNIVIIYTSLVDVIIYDEASVKQTEGSFKEAAKQQTCRYEVTENPLPNHLFHKDYLQRKVSFQLLLSSTVLFYTATTLENEEHVETKTAFFCINL